MLYYFSLIDDPFMSRTTRGGKGPGFEYWTKRPGNRNGGTPGVFTKKTTHRTERQQGKQDCRNGTTQKDIKC